MFLREKRNPLITRSAIKSKNPKLNDVTSVFNPGAALFEDNVLLLLRVQNRGRETFIIKAESKDGLNFEIGEEPVSFKGLSDFAREAYHVYDPRISLIGDEYYITIALDFEKGTRMGFAVTKDFMDYDFIGISEKIESRNGVLFPRKFGGKFYLLERPNDVILPGGVKTGNSIVLSESADMINWRIKYEVMKGRDHYWDELIGAGPPPIATEEGWLLIYHGVATHFGANNIYQAGIVLLDKDKPWIVKNRHALNLLEPREPYELIGQVPNVVFPTGATIKNTVTKGDKPGSRKLNLYYGAADTSVCLAYSSIEELLKLLE